jgi:hypothetical protein
MRCAASQRQERFSSNHYRYFASFPFDFSLPSTFLVFEGPDSTLASAGLG